MVPQMPSTEQLRNQLQKTMQLRSESRGAEFLGMELISALIPAFFEAGTEIRFRNLPAF